MVGGLWSLTGRWAVVLYYADLKHVLLIGFDIFSSIFMILNNI